MIIQFLAVVSGLVVIIWPLINVLRSSKRTKGRAVGSGSGFRRWPAVVGMAVGLVVIGAILWKPFPLEMSRGVKNILLVVGSLAYFPAIGLYLWGLVTLGKEFGVSTSRGADIYADHQLIRGGPYEWVRHPMYLAVVLAAIGALMIFRTWAMVIFFPMTLTVIRRAEKEEEVLAEKFGEEWQEYVARVPKWLPRYQAKERNKGAI